MSAAVSPATSKRYGVKRTCEVRACPRSSFYFRRSPKPRPARRPGPKPRWTDEELLQFIRRDLERSPFQGEGHRKVWARLKVLDGVRVSRKRLLKIMREHNLLSPYRGRRGNPHLHEGRIITDTPNLMWGTDGTRILTVEDGWVWLFGAVEHWNAECVGWQVSKSGSRFEALQPVAMGLTEIFGGVGADVARGLALRLDHGSQYLSDHFLQQIRFWGIIPSFAFVSEPQTNGVVERFFRTLKEQVIYGRIFNNLEEVRAAVAEFVAAYNDNWRLEKLGFMSPIEYRATLTRKAA